MMEKNEKSDLSVNKFKLDEAAESQIGLYHYWAEELATAKAEKDRMKTQLKFTESEVEMEYRKLAADEGGIKGVKATEGVISACVTSDLRIKKLQDKLDFATETVYHLEAMVETLNNRKDEVSNLIKLFLASYFSRPDGKESKTDTASLDARRSLNRQGADE